MTYTYNEENVPIIELPTDDGEPSGIYAWTLDNNHWRLYIQKLRKKQSFKYYGVSEYGTKTQRPHFHAIMINQKPYSSKFEKDVRKTWDLGFSMTGDVTASSIRYVIKYMSKRLKNTPEYCEEPKTFISKNLGAEYLDNAKHHIDNDLLTVRLDNGVKIPLPLYYKHRIWNTPELKGKLKYLEIQRSLDLFKEKSISDHQLLVLQQLAREKFNRAVLNEKKNSEKSQCKRF